MIKVHWRPRQVSRTALGLIALLSVIGFAAVERFQVQTKQRFHKEKLAASHLAAEAFEVLGRERAKLGHKPDPVSDPTGSGLMGELMTSVTSNSGNIRAKQTTINPNFAAVVVDMLRRAGVEEGDTIAIGFSGSFPALNVCVMAAAKTMGLEAIIISSNSASQWGANAPELLWVDWERILVDKKVFTQRSAAASIGGIEDRGLGMSAEGRDVITAAIERNGVPLLTPRDYADSVEQRMRLFTEKAGSAPIKAYVNVGGGTTSVGTRVGKHIFKPGLNVRPPVGGPAIDSVMSRFADDGVPVIHLINVNPIARRYGLEVSPKQMPQVGVGKVFSRAEYNPWIAGGFLAAIFVALYAFVRSDVGFRIMQLGGRKKGSSHPEPMI